MTRLLCPCLAVLLFVATAAAACGEDPSREQSRDDTAPRAAQSDQERYEEATERFENGTFTIRYEAATSDVPGTISATLYRQGDEKGRYDFRIEPNEELLDEFPDATASSLISITTPTHTAVCTESIGALFLFVQLRDRSCIDAGGLDSNAQDQLASQSPAGGAIADDEARVTGRSERQIAGEHAECFSLVIEADDGEGEEPYELCFGESGALLSWGVIGDDESFMTATDTSISVDEGVFELPFPVTSLATLEIHNRASTAIFVNAHSEELGDFIDGQIEIDAGEDGTLRTGAGGDPVEIYLGTYEIPQWSWECTWSSAKANEPLVVTDGHANCTDVSPEQ